jgi:glycerol dehydrogenase
MGDGLSTFYEARAVRASGRLILLRFSDVKRAYALQSSVNDLILEYGVAAEGGVKRVNGARRLKKIVEGNIYLSGLGFENNGLAIARMAYIMVLCAHLQAPSCTTW